MQNIINFWLGQILFPLCKILFSIYRCSLVNEKSFKFNEILLPLSEILLPLNDSIQCTTVFIGDHEISCPLNKKVEVYKLP